MHGIQRKTNKYLEGLHLQLNRAIGKTNADIYECISKLIREQGATETLLFQIEAGDISIGKSMKEFTYYNRIYYGE